MASKSSTPRPGVPPLHLAFLIRFRHGIYGVLHAATDDRRTAHWRDICVAQKV
jgi:hypothetical protein